MSYDGEKMDSLRIQLRKFEGLKEEVKRFNDNIDVFERIALALEKQNELKEQELQYQYTKKLQK